MSEIALPAKTFSLSTSRQLRRRRFVNRVMEVIAALSAFLAIAVLANVVFNVGKQGAGAINFDFFTKTESTDFLNPGGGGIAFALIGTSILIGIAAAIAVPLGVLIALFLTEFARPTTRRIIQITLDVMNGFPSIVIGIFIFALITLRFGQSAIAGGIALSVIMLPLIARSTQEVLLLVPRSLREASLALGVSRWRTVLSIVVPSAIGGIVTGTTLAIARAAGETAPLLFTSALGTRTSIDADPTHPLYSMTQTIYEYSDQAAPELREKAWATAFVLMCFVLAISLTAKAFLARTRRKLSS